MSTISAEELSSVFVEVADTLVRDFDVIEFVQMVTSRTAALIDAAAVGLLLSDHDGRLHVMAASNEATMLLELFQVQNEEGPCLDAYTTGRAVTNADLREAADRWPVFAPRAADAGFRSVHAIPMRLREEVIGAMNVFTTRGGELSAPDVRIIQSLADAATIGLLQQRAIHRRELLTEQLQSALDSRIVIEQAKGALARIHGVSVDEAFTLLRTYSRRTSSRLGDVAAAVVNDPAAVPELTSG